MLVLNLLSSGLLVSHLYRYIYGSVVAMQVGAGQSGPHGVAAIEIALAIGGGTVRMVSIGVAIVRPAGGAVQTRHVSDHLISHFLSHTSPCLFLCSPQLPYLHLWVPSLSCTCTTMP